MKLRNYGKLFTFNKTVYGEETVVFDVKYIKHILVFRWYKIVLNIPRLL